MIMYSRGLSVHVGQSFCCAAYGNQSFQRTGLREVKEEFFCVKIFFGVKIILRKNFSCVKIEVFRK